MKKRTYRSERLPPFCPLGEGNECRYCDRKIAPGEWYSLSMPGDPVCGLCTMGLNKTARLFPSQDPLFSNDPLGNIPLEQTYEALLEEFSDFRDRTLKSVRRGEKQAELLEELYCRLVGLAERDVVPAEVKQSLAAIQEFIALKP